MLLITASVEYMDSNWKKHFAPLIKSETNEISKLKKCLPRFFVCLFLFAFSGRLEGNSFVLSSPTIFTKLTLK